jgi:hypothetical protein
MRALSPARVLVVSCGLFVLVNLVVGCSAMARLGDSKAYGSAASKDDSAVNRDFARLPSPSSTMSTPCHQAPPRCLRGSAGQLVLAGRGRGRSLPLQAGLVVWLVLYWMRFGAVLVTLGR